MPTQRLIDINTSAITYRRECLTALRERRYPDCVGSIKTLNAVLPADNETHKYRIVFDTEQYHAKVDKHFMIVCNHCNKEQQYSDIIFYDLNLTAEDAIIYGVSKRTYWNCPKCKEQNELTQSEVIESSLEKPYYLRYVPDPPSISNGLVSKLEFHKKMVEWVWLCLNSLEEGFARFRDDNWNKIQEEEFDLNIDTSEEEKG